MIVAPGAGSAFDLVALPITNTGTLKAEGGGTLRLDNAQVTNPDGTIRAEDGSVVELARLTTIQGGVLETAGSGVIRNVGSAGLLLPIQNRGLFETANGAATGIVGVAAAPVSLINSGTVKLASTGATTQLEIIDRVRFTGTGVVELGDNPNNRIVGSGAAIPELINGPRHTLRGAGSITGLGGGSTPIGFTNNGSVIADAENPLILDAQFVNNGHMKATGSGGLVMNGNRSKNVGTIQVDVGSQLDINLGPVGLDNEGTVSIDGTATGSVFNKGSGTVGGSGTHNGYLLNQGRTRPTPVPGSDRQTGIFMLDGDLEQQGAEAVVDIGFEEVITVLRGGASAHSVLHVTGHVTLDGSLALTRIAGFEPADGESFAILTFASRTGTFQNVTGMAAGGGNVFRVQYNPNDVTVRVGPAAAADLDQDGDADADDFLTLDACVTGPAVLYDPQNLPAGCALTVDPDGFIGADFDRDGDVDLGDLRVAQICQSGPDVPADPTCPAP